MNYPDKYIGSVILVLSASGLRRKMELLDSDLKYFQIDF
jgi:hypothetical protein